MYSKTLQWSFHILKNHSHLFYEACTKCSECKINNIHFLHVFSYTGKSPIVVSQPKRFIRNTRVLSGQINFKRSHNN